MLQQSQNETFECFKMEASEILSEMKNYHSHRERQIERVFDIINDNLPDDLKNETLSETFEKFLSVIRNQVQNYTEQLVNQTDIVDDSLYSADFSSGRLADFIF